MNIGNHGKNGNGHKTPESVAQAQRAVEVSRMRVEASLEELEGKLLAATSTAQDLIYRFRTPERLAKQHPWLNLAFFLVAGVLIGIQSRRLAQQQELYGEDFSSVDEPTARNTPTGSRLHSVRLSRVGGGW